MLRCDMARQFDIHFQSLPASEYYGTKPFTFGQTRSLGIAGLQKLVNLFLKYLMTPIGTNPLDLDEGTEVPGLIGSNVNVDDAKEILVLAVEKTVGAITARQSMQPPPDDEMLAGATVTDFISIPALQGFSAQIYIRNVEGAELTFLLPALTGGL